MHTVVYYTYIFILFLSSFIIINIIVNFSNFLQFELLLLRIVKQKFHIIYETNFELQLLS